MRFGGFQLSKKNLTQTDNATWGLAKGGKGKGGTNRGVGKHRGFP